MGFFCVGYGGIYGGFVLVSVSKCLRLLFRHRRGLVMDSIDFIFLAFVCCFFCGIDTHWSNERCVIVRSAFEVVMFEWRVECDRRLDIDIMQKQNVQQSKEHATYR